MSIRILLLFIAVIHFGFLSAQEGILKGKITDDKTKEAFGGVSVYIDKIGSAISNPDGIYEVKILAGSHSIEFKFIGYTTKSQTILIKEGETAVLDIALTPEATELGVMVVSAGKFEQKLDEVTVSMDVLKPVIIENKNTTSVENILEQVPGVNVLDGQANIRGGSGFSYGAGSRVMVLVDDLPLLSGDAGDVKWDFIPVENIEQVEIIKGASSALFGSSALNGVINFRTSYPKDTAHTSVSLSSGVYNKPKRDELVWWGNTNPIYSNASFFHSRQIKNFDLTIGGNAFSDDGYRKLENEQRYRFNFGTRYRFQKIKGLSAGINGNYRDTNGGLFLLWQSGDSAYYPQGGSVSRYHTTRATLDPFITYFTPNGNRHSLKTRFYETINLNNTNQESRAYVYYGEYQYQLHLKKDLTITSGITSNYSEVHSDSLYKQHFSSSVGIFSQADKKFRRFIFSLGVRGEYFKVDTAETKTRIRFGKDTAILPIHPVFRVGMNYKLFSHTHLRASFGQGYRFPSVAEKFIATKVSGLTILPNPKLQPETGWSAEIGAKQAFKISNFRGYLDLAGFWQEYNNMMEFTFSYWDVPKGTSIWSFPKYFGAKSVNVGRTKIIGIEPTVVGEGKIGQVNISILAGYTYIVPLAMTYDSTGSDKKFAPNHFQQTVLGIKDSTTILKYRYTHTAKCDVQADYKKWSIGISLRYNSFMKNIDRKFQDRMLEEVFPTWDLYILPGLKEYREKHNKGDIVFDARLAFQLTKQVKTSLVINNLFNREFMGRPGDVQPPRMVAFMLSAKI